MAPVAVRDPNKSGRNSGSIRLARKGEKTARQNLAPVRKNEERIISKSAAQCHRARVKNAPEKTAGTALLFIGILGAPDQFFATFDHRFSQRVGCICAGTSVPADYGISRGGDARDRSSRTYNAAGQRV